MTIKQIVVKYLIKSQRFTKTDNVYLATQGSFLAVGNIISTLASFLLAVAFARLLPKEVYGNYRYIISIVTMIGILGLPGIDDAVLQAVANKFEGCLKTAFKKRIRWATLGSLACLVVAAVFFFKNDFNLTISFIIAGVFFPLMESTTLYLSYLGGKKLFGVQVKYSTLAQIIATLAIIITLFFSKSLIIIVLIYFLSNTLIRAFFYLLTVKKFPANNNQENGFITFGKHLTLVRVVKTISSQIDKMLLFQFVGATQLAIYSFATLPTSEANIFLQNIRLLALPKLSTRSKQEIKKSLLKKVIIGTLLIIPLVAVYILIAPYVFKIFFPQYMDSVFYSQLYALTIIAFPASMFALTFQAKMMKKELYRFNIISPFVEILFLVILTPLYGIMGIIISRLIGQFFAVGYALVLFKKI
ncbi:MAG: oligosaccharide flippase family protein [Nanoarchaeota archaeon]|nr:oligosaccharide flippase family protein [Nanoarchaeota archaeon]